MLIYILFKKNDLNFNNSRKMSLVYIVALVLTALGKSKI